MESKLIKESKPYKLKNQRGQVVKHYVYILEENNIKIIHHRKRLLIPIDMPLGESKVLKVFKDKKLVQVSSTDMADSLLGIVKFVYGIEVK